MGRITLPKASVQQQLTAVRRAASKAALDCRSDGRTLKSTRSKAEIKRDELHAAAITLGAVRDSQIALSMMPDAQRDQLSIRLAALGYRAVLVEDVVPNPEALGV